MQYKINRGVLMGSSKRLLELDALRGIAVIAVILYHYTTRYDQYYGHLKDDYWFNFSHGHMGVQLFFMISGFVIYMSILNINNSKDFFIKRAIRLYPVYIFGVLFTFTITNLYILDKLRVSFPEMLVNLTMFQGYLPFVEPVDGAYWSLRVEVFFYILIGVLFYLKLHKKIILISIILLLVASGLNVLANVMNLVLLDNLNQVLIVNYIHLFIAGIMFYHIRMQDDIKYHLTLAVCLIYQFAFIEPISGLYVLVFFGMFYLMVYNKMSWISIKPLLFIGSISYSLYLVHQYVGYAIIHWLENIGNTGEYNIIIPMVFSFVVAILMTKYIEKPIQNVLYQKYRSYKQKRNTIQRGVSAS
jgi:peptidoglycan/LPS O-acetylase OafA/YrhL